MKFAPIVPPQGLRILERVGVGYHFVLGQELIRNKEYRQYYAALGRLGHFIIVDNGAAERDTPPFSEIVRFANYINAAEIILPDVLGDMNATVDALTPEVLGLVPSRKRMIVPQGESMEEWFTCLEYQLKATQYCIESIGVAKHFEARIEGGRARVLERLARMYPTIVQNIHIHLLGVWHDPFEEMAAAAAQAPVRGIDSGIPIAWAQRHRELGPESIMDVEEHLSMDWDTPIDNMELARKNVWELVRFAAEVGKVK